MKRERLSLLRGKKNKTTSDSLLLVLLSLLFVVRKRLKNSDQKFELTKACQNILVEMDKIYIYHISLNLENNILSAAFVSSTQPGVEVGCKGCEEQMRETAAPGTSSL